MSGKDVYLLLVIKVVLEVNNICVNIIIWFWRDVYYYLGIIYVKNVIELV